MNTIDNFLLKRICEEAIYNLCLYETDKLPFKDNASLGEIVAASSEDSGSIGKIKAAVSQNPFLEKSVIRHYVNADGGIVSCVFLRPDGEASVVFKGTGSGEWADNGEGLSGIEYENAYVVCGWGEGESGMLLQNNHSTYRQVEALNRFNEIICADQALSGYRISVSGHSKGGNKAQYIAMQSPIPKNCFSFNGQGFSPEAVEMFRDNLGEDFAKRRRKIISLCSENDYVHVLGQRLALMENTYYFKSSGGIHDMASLINTSGVMNAQCEMGALPGYVASVSEEIMELSPGLRRYVTEGVMRVFENHLAETGELKEDISGVLAGIRRFLKQLDIRDDIQGLF